MIIHGQVADTLQHVTAAELRAAVQAGVQAGHISPAHAGVLSPQETLAMLQFHVPAVEKAALAAKAAHRNPQLAANVQASGTPADPTHTHQG